MVSRALSWLTKSFQAIITCACLATLCACNRAENRANELFISASQAVSKARLFEESHPADALKLYEQAKENIETIYSDYHATSMAKALQSGKATLDGITVKELRSKIIPNFQLMLAASQDPMKLVEALIPQVPSALAQAQLALGLADKLIRAHRPDEALQQIKITLRAIDGIGSISEQIALLLKLAIIYNDLGIRDKTLEVTFRALTLAKQIPAPESRQSILSDIAFTYYRARAEQKGYEAIRSIQDSRKEQDSLRTIAQKLGDENLFSESLAVTSALRDSPGKALFLTELAAAAIGKDLCESASPFLDAAVKLSDTFSDKNDEARLWLTIATLLHRCGKDSESAASLDKAVHASGEGAHNANYAETAQLISSLARAYADIGQVDTAHSLIASSLAIAQKERNQKERDHILADLSITLAATKELDRAERVMSSIKEFGELARASVQIARILHSIGKTDRAVSLLSRIKNKVSESPDPEERTSTLLLLRDCYFDMKRLNDALDVGFLLREYGESWRRHIRTLNEQLVAHGEVALALRLAREINDPYLGGVLLADIARFQSKWGSLNEAVALMEEAFRVTQKGSDPKRSAAMNQYFAEALLLMNWPKQAYDLVQANKLENKPLWLARIAVAYSEQGKQDAAAQTLGEALTLAAALSPLDSQLQTLIELASAFALTGVEPDSTSQNLLWQIFKQSSAPIKKLNNHAAP